MGIYGQRPLFCVSSSVQLDWTGEPIKGLSLYIWKVLGSTHQFVCLFCRLLLTARGVVQCIKKDLPLPLIDSNRPPACPHPANWLWTFDSWNFTEPSFGRNFPLDLRMSSPAFVLLIAIHFVSPFHHLSSSYPKLCSSRVVAFYARGPWSEDEVLLCNIIGPFGWGVLWSSPRRRVYWVQSGI